MSTASIIIGALDRLNSAKPAFATLLVATRQMCCALAPRTSAVCVLDTTLLALVARSPTVWCTAELRVDAPDPLVTRVLAYSPCGSVVSRCAEEPPRTSTMSRSSR